LKIEDRLYEFIVKSIPDHAMRTVNFY